MATEAGATRGPRAGRPAMPASYGIHAGPERLLPWSWAVERLERARNYWLATTRPDGRPHVAPVWGVWLDGAFYFDTGPESTKARNLAANPALALHLESGNETVILEGSVEVARAPETLARVAAAYSAKYGFAYAPDPARGVYALRPRVAFGWVERDFPGTATRWRFSEAGA